MLRKLSTVVLAVLLAVGVGLLGPAGAAAQESDAQIGQVTGLFEAEPVVYQITFPRVQAIVVPAFMLGLFLDEHPNHWSDGQTNWAFGGEFIIRRLDEYDLVFSVDYADLRTTDDWWRGSDDPIIDSDWGQNNLGLLTFDVSINWFTSLMEAWEIYYGVGLGVGFVIGDFLKTEVERGCIPAGVDRFDSTDGAIIRANCFDEQGNPRLEPGARTEEEDGVWPLIPALSLQLGSRWIIDRNWAVQLEVGFKSIYFYGGLELGYIF